MREIFIVIPASDRHEMISELLTSILQPASNVILIDNGSNPPLRRDFDKRAFVVHNYPTKLNIQSWWNLGWEIAESRAMSKDNYAVVFLNSDAMTTRRDIETLVKHLDESNASVTFFDHCRILGRGQINRRTKPGPGTWEHKMSGWCFAVRGELQTRFDESMAWWYGDDDFDWRARREFGGVVMVGGTWADNRDWNGAQRDNPELHEQIEKDHQRFIEKWGCDIMDPTVLDEETYDRMVRVYD